MAVYVNGIGSEGGQAADTIIRILLAMLVQDTSHERFAATVAGGPNTGSPSRPADGALEYTSDTSAKQWGRIPGRRGELYCSTVAATAT